MCTSHKALAHVQVEVLAVWHDETCFILIPRSDQHSPVAVQCICNEKTCISGSNYCFKDFVYRMCGVLQFDSDLVDRDKVVDDSELIRPFLFRREFGLCPPFTHAPDNDSCFLHLWEDLCCNFPLFQCVS